MSESLLRRQCRVAQSRRLENSVYISYDLADWITMENLAGEYQLAVYPVNSSGVWQLCRAEYPTLPGIKWRS